MGVHKYKYNFSFFDYSEECFYFMGFAAADGYINQDGIEIAINEKDKYLLEFFRDNIVPDKPLYYKKDTNSYTLKLSLRNKMWIAKAFYGMSEQSNKKWAEVRFPTEEVMPKEYIRHFIRGYVDGDGCIDTTKGYRGSKVYIGPRLRILGNFPFLTALNKITKEFIDHNTNAITKKGKENIYCVTYNFSTARKILDWLYGWNTICLERKYKRYLEVTSQDEDIV